VTKRLVSAKGTFSIKSGTIHLDGLIINGIYTFDS